MPSYFNHLASPVVLVTAGRGREVFNDSAKLMRRLAELPAMGERILSIQNQVYCVSEDGIAALETMLHTVGFRPFRVASKRKGNPFTRFGTRWSWAFLSDYLGWRWRALR
jgi:hypothetical protein